MMPAMPSGARTTPDVMVAIIMTNASQARAVMAKLATRMTNSNQIAIGRSRAMGKVTAKLPHQIW